MLSAILTWLASSGASLILGFLAQVIRDVAADRRASQSQRDLGAAQTNAAVNGETANAERRASDAAINAERGPGLDDGLQSGRVKF